MTKEIVCSPGLQWKPIASHTGERDDQTIYQKSLMPKAMGHFSSQRIIVFPFNCKFQSRHVLGCLLKCLFGKVCSSVSYSCLRLLYMSPEPPAFHRQEESLKQTATEVPQCVIFFFLQTGILRLPDTYSTYN